MGSEKERGRQLSQILLCVLVIIFASCAIVFVALYFIKYGEDNVDKDMSVDDGIMEPLCSNEACVNYASLVLNNADLSLDPCKDFYAYACSNYVRFTPIPEDGEESVWQSVTSGINWRMKALLEEEYEPSRYPKPVNDALNFYKACMDLDKIEELGTAPIQDLIDFYGGFPAIDPNWDPNNYDLTTLMAKIVKTMPAFSLFFSANINLGVADTSTYGIELAQSYFALLRKDLLEPRNSSVIKAYEQYAIDLAVLMGADEATAEADMKAMVDWEIDMAQYQIPLAEWRQLNQFEVFTIQELYDNITNKIDWIRYFDNIFENTSRRFSLNDTVELHHRLWFDRLADKWDTFDKKNIANSIIVRTIGVQHNALPKAFREAQERRLLITTGSTRRQPRWKECVQETTGFMEWAVGRLYVEEVFNNEFQVQTDDMFRLIRKEMDKMIDTATWFDEITRSRAKDKLKKMKNQLGVPDYIRDNDRLQRYYPGLVVDPQAFLANRRSRFESFKLDFLLRIDKPADKTEWLVSPVIFNAFYYAQQNSMIFPAVFFSEPLFHKDYRGYVNFANAGVVIGHEITHGVDERGRHFDGDGKFNDWWDSETDAVFKNTSQCFVDQYNNFKIAGKQVDGKLTLSENIADQGGLVAAARAYKVWLKEHNIVREQLLPGINLTPDQLFFLSFGQHKCYTGTDEIQIRRLNGVHSPPKYRLNGPLQNSKEFARAFNCPVNSPMNPEKKCTIWNEA